MKWPSYGIEYEGTYILDAIKEGKSHDEIEGRVIEIMTYHYDIGYAIGQSRMARNFYDSLRNICYEYPKEDQAALLEQLLAGIRQNQPKHLDKYFKQLNKKHNKPAKQSTAAGRIIVK